MGVSNFSDAISGTILKPNGHPVYRVKAEFAYRGKYYIYFTLNFHPASCILQDRPFGKLPACNSRMLPDNLRAARKDFLPLPPAPSPVGGQGPTQTYADKYRTQDVAGIE